MDGWMVQYWYTSEPLNVFLEKWKYHTFPHQGTLISSCIMQAVYIFSYSFHAAESFSMQHAHQSVSQEANSFFKREFRLKANPRGHKFHVGICEHAYMKADEKRNSFSVLQNDTSNTRLVERRLPSLPSFTLTSILTSFLSLETIYEGVVKLSLSRTNHIFY